MVEAAVSWDNFKLANIDVLDGAERCNTRPHSTPVQQCTWPPGCYTVHRSSAVDMTPWLLHCAQKRLLQVNKFRIRLTTSTSRLSVNKERWKSCWLWNVFTTSNAKEVKYSEKWRLNIWRSCSLTRCIIKNVLRVGAVNPNTWWYSWK